MSQPWAPRAQKAIVITAASSPVALATAARLAAGGDLVLMGTRRPDICERFAAELRSDGAAAFAAYLDLADPPSVDRFVKSADYLIGAVDVLVSAAGLADGSWVGAQHFAAQVIPPMIDNRCGDVVLISPALVGGSSATADRMLEAWVAGLDAEFVGTGVRASIIRATGTHGGRVPPDDIACLIAAAISSPEQMHLRVVDVIAPVPAASISALTD
ncbi:MAG: SDR family NAD(P)-dependent oxidoreductase [Mycobacterium sp.]|uniref:SDR family NAD(P)-dependent oxidoreductase n=1 Tax=Mycobacterium sp. TaxID=1785 RepID=UPI003BAE5D80